MRAMTHVLPHLPDPETHPEFYAGVPVKRLIAWGADIVLILLATLVLSAATLFLALFVFPALFAAVHLAYRIFFIMRDSATPGMRLMGIELRDVHGARLGPGAAVLHTLAYSLTAVLVLPLLVSVVLIWTGARAQGLHDLLLGTAAINRPEGVF